MSGKFQNRYRITSARAPWWDYGRNALYFVTICTHNRICYFGEIPTSSQPTSSKSTSSQPASAQFVASPLGEIAQTCWYKIPQHFPFVQLGAFVVMPDHVHGIIIINKPDNVIDPTDIANANVMDNVVVETRLIASLRLTNQLTDQFTGQPTNQFTGQPPKQPTKQLTNQLTNQFTEQPPKQPTGQLTGQPKTTGGFAGNKNPMLNNNLSRIIRWYKGRTTFEAHKIDTGFEWQARFHENIIRDEKSYRNISDYIINNYLKWNDDNLNFI